LKIKVAKKNIKKTDLCHLIDNIITDNIKFHPRYFKFSLMRTTFKSNYFFKWSMVEKHHQVNKKNCRNGNVKPWNHSRILCSVVGFDFNVLMMIDILKNCALLFGSLDLNNFQYIHHHFCSLKIQALFLQVYVHK
jgi:hypothetical protein